MRQATVYVLAVRGKQKSAPKLDALFEIECAVLA